MEAKKISDKLIEITRTVKERKSEVRLKEEKQKYEKTIEELNRRITEINELLRLFE